jgi:hypothetical protein
MSKSLQNMLNDLPEERRSQINQRFEEELAEYYDNQAVKNESVILKYSSHELS